eukprot:3934440-Rhodomonas_salina.1
MGTAVDGLQQFNVASMLGLVHGGEVGNCSSFCSACRLHRWHRWRTDTLRLRLYVLCSSV